MRGAAPARAMTREGLVPVGDSRGVLGSHGVRVWIIRLTVIAAFVAAWKLTGVLGILNPVFIGSPEGTLAEFFLQFGKPGALGLDLGYTIAETLIGFAIGSAGGVLCAVILFRAPAARQAVAPLIVAANSLPRVALAPLFVLWFGLGIAGKAALVVSLVFFVMLTTTLAGLTQPNKDYEYLARSLGASRRQHILYFIVPAAVPTIVAGLELSLTYSFLGAVAGEIVGGSFGIGVRLTAFANAFEIDKFMALLLLLVIMSTAAVQLMRHSTAKLTRWHATELGHAH
ncbi:MAG: ABC transporter permease [Rhodospirillaceae bacterium]|nr:ABC transporter permease [Rhodospirillaceae bacterium]